MESMIGQGRAAIDMIADAGSFRENMAGTKPMDGDYGPGAIVGTCTIDGKPALILANDTEAMNPRFPVVYFGVIGMEEAYKMASAVYEIIEADREKPVEQKHALVLIVDTPGNAPGKVEEIIGMNKATGAYQLALAEARKQGHAVIAIVIGRAISGAFLCHGLQADHILALSKEYGAIIHVMPLTSISRITKIDIERLEEMSRENPVFASGVDFFYRLGGVEEIVEKTEEMHAVISRHIMEVRRLKAAGNHEACGPAGRGILGEKRKGRTARPKVMRIMEEEYRAVEENYLK